MNVPQEFKEKFEKMRAVGIPTKMCLDELERIIQPGIRTLDIDIYVRVFAKRHMLVLAQEGYKGFPAACCTSVNHIICHGIPGPKVLKKGDIIKVDVTFIKDGWYGDSCRCYAVGEINIRTSKLMLVTYEAMWKGIEAAKPGNKIRDISKAIQVHAESNGFSVVRDFCGHGIGTVFHTAPGIPNYVYEWDGIDQVLEPGMTFTIEPMLNAGSWAYKTLKDGWTTVTRDREMTAQYEHTIGITNDGNVVFTK